jgi:hypothetical protein
LCGMASADDAANGHAYAAWLAQALRSSRATPLPVDPLVGQLPNTVALMLAHKALILGDIQ